MNLIHQKKAIKPYPLVNVDKPELYRDIFPYTRISRVEFDDNFLLPRPANPMFITDTTLRDGQQARPPYTVQQGAQIYNLLHNLGGKSGLIQAAEFFMYSKKDRKTIETCRAMGYRFPRITGWIRANLNDLEIARSMEFEEVGMLTSVSDYHIHLKLNKTRKEAMDDYLRVASKALEWGIMPRCHFEDITRADIYGFCIPFAQRLMELSAQSNMPVKIRLCDTMGNAVPYHGAALPRSVQRIVRAFTDEAGVPGAWLEWHGHNDYHYTLINAVTAWLYGCGGVNGALMGFGDRTGNTPIEALVINYIGLTGNDDAADTRVITDIAEFFSNELGHAIPSNYPFAGRDFNATSAGVHADGLAKNEEIYNVFDTEKLLNRPVSIIITDTSGRAGVAYWINQNLRLPEGRKVSKTHPAVGHIYAQIMKAYEDGRNTSFSSQEMTALVQRFMPELFETQFEQAKRLAGKLAAHLVEKLAKECVAASGNADAQACITAFGEEYPFIQYTFLTDKHGQLLAYSFTGDPDYQDRYKELSTSGFDFSVREWFKKPMENGQLYITDVYQSYVTGRLILTVSTAVTNEKDEITGILGADIQLEEILRRAPDLEELAAQNDVEEEV